MLRIVSVLISLIMLFPSMAQETFSVEIESLVIDNAPEVHSYSWAKTTNDEWLIFGGRVQGLHQRQPFAAFQASGNNLEVSLMNITTNQVVTASLSSLSELYLAKAMSKFKAEIESFMDK